MAFDDREDSVPDVEIGAFFNHTTCEGEKIFELRFAISNEL